MVPASGAVMTLAATFNRTNEQNFLVKNQKGAFPDTLINRPLRYDFLSCTLNPIRLQKARCMSLRGYDESHNCVSFRPQMRLCTGIPVEQWVSKSCFEISFPR